MSATLTIRFVQVNFNTRWSFSEEEDENSAEGSSDYDHLDDYSDYENDHLYVNEEAELSSVAASPVGELNDAKLSTLRRALATNFHGRWSLSTRESDYSFDESDDHDWIAPRNNSNRLHPLKKLPLCQQWSDSSAEVTCVEKHTRPKQAQGGDEIQTTLQPILRNNSAAARLNTRWSVYDDDDYDDGDHEKFHTEHCFCSRDELSDTCRYKLELEDCLQSMADLTQSGTKTNSTYSRNYCRHKLEQASKTNGISIPKLGLEANVPHLLSADSKMNSSGNSRPTMGLDLGTEQDPRQTDTNTSIYPNKLETGMLPSHSQSQSTNSPESTQRDTNKDIMTHTEPSAVSPKSSRPKPPIKPRKKLPKRSTDQPQPSRSPSQGSESVLTTSSSAPSIHVPKAAPRKPFLRAVSVHSYDQIQPYQSIADIDQDYVDKILRTSRNARSSAVHYYNLPASFTCSAAVRDMDEHSYEQVQRYEKIQTYETIPYQLELDFRNT